MNNSTKTQSISLSALIALGMIIFGVRLHVINTFGVQMPYWDDWGMGGLLYNHHTLGLTFQELTQHINQHRQVFGKLISVVLFELNHQQWDTYVMMVANTVIWTVSGLFLINIARKHHHEINPTPIILLLLVLWTYPISLVNTVWGVQSHVYFMTFFAILGCWYAGEQPFSKKWWLAIFCLFGGGLTLAGGSFIGISVAAVYLTLAFVDKPKRMNHTWTCLFAALGGIFGLMLILVQPGSSSLTQDLFSIDALATFIKTMSWPVRSHLWPFLIFLTPILVLYFNLLKNRTNDSRLVPFLLSLYGFIVIIAIAIASARNSDGAGPAKRYADFLALGFVASSFALLVIQQKQFRLPRLVNQLLILLWIGAIIIAIPSRIEVTRHTVDDRASILSYQEKYVRQYINTDDTEWLTGKVFRHVPFPRPDSLGKHLINFEEADILPYSLQKTPPLTHNPDQSPPEWEKSGFIPNGFYLPSKGILPTDGWYGENIMGSFYAKKGGGEMTGNFESNTFEIDRPYVMIPIIGYAGYPDMLLKLVDVGSGREIIIEPEVRSSTYAEEWREVMVKAKRGYYKLVAEDYNKKLWFGFAAPRTVGRLSYTTQKLLDLGQFIWLTGIALLCLINRKKIAHSISHQPR